MQPSWQRLLGDCSLWLYNRWRLVLSTSYETMSDHYESCEQLIPVVDPMNRTLVIRIHQKTIDIDCAWARHVFMDERPSFPGPRDLGYIYDCDEYMDLYFETVRGFYFAWGYLTQKGLCFSMGRREKYVEENRIRRALRFQKHCCRGLETPYRLYVKSPWKGDLLSVDSVLSQTNLWNDVSTVRLIQGGAYAFVSVSSWETVYFLLGFYLDSRYLTVQMKNTD